MSAYCNLFAKQNQPGDCGFKCSLQGPWGRHTIDTSFDGSLPALVLEPLYHHSRDSFIWWLVSCFLREVKTWHSESSGLYGGWSNVWPHGVDILMQGSIPWEHGRTFSLDGGTKVSEGCCAELKHIQSKTSAPWCTAVPAAATKTRSIRWKVSSAPVSLPMGTIFNSLYSFTQNNPKVDLIWIPLSILYSFNRNIWAVL
jgi:hypothetical protein